MATKRPRRTPRDRWADWAVIGTVALALLLGWGVKALAGSGYTTYTDAATGLTVRYPERWLLLQDENLLFQAIDPDSGEYKTTYQVALWPAAAGEPITATLSQVLNNASMARAQQNTAYRLFDLMEGDLLDGLPTMEATYVFVDESDDLFTQHMPVVVLGMDIALERDGQVYVFTLLAAEDNFAAAEKPFRRFVKTATYGGGER